MDDGNDPMGGDLIQDLRRVDRPMAPSDEFETRLRSELFGDGVALQPKRGPSRQRPRIGVLVAAAASLLAVVAAAVFVVGRDDRQDAIDGTDQDSVTSTTLEPGVDLTAARQACQIFTAQAFGDLTQVQVAGPNNAVYLPTIDAVVVAATRLDTAIVRLGDDLAAAELRNAEFVAQAERARRSLAESLKLAAAGRLPNAQREMGQMDEHLERVARALTQVGVTGCV